MAANIKGGVTGKDDEENLSPSVNHEVCVYVKSSSLMARSLHSKTRKHFLITNLMLQNNLREKGGQGGVDKPYTIHNCCPLGK